MARRESRAARIARARELLASGEGRKIREAHRLSGRTFASSMVPPISHTSLKRWEDGVGMPGPEPALAYERLIAELEQIGQ